MFSARMLVLTEVMGVKSYTVLPGVRISFMGARSATIRSRRGPMRPRQATTFDNCHNQLRDVLHPILGLRTGRYLREPSRQRYVEVVRRSARSTQRTSRRFLTDRRADHR